MQRRQLKEARVTSHLGSGGGCQEGKGSKGGGNTEESGAPRLEKENVPGRKELPTVPNAARRFNTIQLNFSDTRRAVS